MDKVKPDFWIYANLSEQQYAAASLIKFGEEVFKKAKLVRDIDKLKIIVAQLDRGDINIKSLAPEHKKMLFLFSSEYLIDCVRIIVFFENYMKAQLISQGFCVHMINKDLDNFKGLAKEQHKRPITVSEINSLEAFKKIEDQEIFTHDALKETTLGITTLLGSSKYLEQYHLKKNMIEHLKEINLNRNKLHFHEKIEFTFSEPFIEKIEQLMEFVKTISGKIEAKPESSE